MAIYNSPCETTIVLPVWLGVGHTEITRRLHIKDHRSRPHFEAKMQVLPQVLQCGGYSAIPLQPAKSLPIGNPQRHDMCSQVFLPNELGTSQNCWGRFVSFTTCFKNTFIPFETIWSLKKIPIKKYWHPKYKIKPMNCINSSPSLWVSHFFPLSWTQQKASQLFHPKTFMLRVEKWHKKWKKHQVVFPCWIARI